MLRKFEIWLCDFLFNLKCEVGQGAHPLAYVLFVFGLVLSGLQNLYFYLRGFEFISGIGRIRVNRRTGEILK